jgi:hypothetical protein
MSTLAIYHSAGFRYDALWGNLFQNPSDFVALAYVILRDGGFLFFLRIKAASMPLACTNGTSQTWTVG